MKCSNIQLFFVISKGKHSSYSWIPRSPGPPEGSSKGVTQDTESEWNNLYISGILLQSLIPGKQKTFEVHFVCIAPSWMRSALIHLFSRAEPNRIVYWIWNWIFNFLWSAKEFEKEEKIATNYFDTTIFPSNIAYFAEDCPWEPNTIQVNQVHHQKLNMWEVIWELMFLSMVFSILFYWKTDTHYRISSMILLAENLFVRFMRQCWQVMQVFKRAEGHHVWLVCE